IASIFSSPFVTPSYLWALSHLDSLVGARIEEVGILHVEQKTNILAGNRPCALVKTRYEWQLLNWVSGWRKASAPVTSAKLTVAVTGLGVPVRYLLITLTLSGRSNPGYYTKGMVSLWNFTLLITA